MHSELLDEVQTGEQTRSAEYNSIAQTITRMAGPEGANVYLSCKLQMNACAETIKSRGFWAQSVYGGPERETNISLVSS